MKNLLKLLSSTLLGVSLTGVALAGDVFYDMDTDPTSYPGFILFGNHVGSAWYPSDGNPASGGYLSVTDAVANQNLGIIFPEDYYTNADLTIEPLPLKAFKIELDARIGNGTVERPADGFSISFARTADPVIYWASQATPAFEGFAGGDSLAVAIQAASNPAGCTAVTAENGTKTGLAILFDTWQGNYLPRFGISAADPTAANDAEGISVRLDDVTLRQTFFTNAPGVYDRNGSCDDTNSMQTGPWNSDAQGAYSGLCWAHFSAELDTNQQVTVIWKGRKILDHFQLTNYPTSRGRLIFAGRTGGNNENTHIDNVHVVTVPDVIPTFNGITLAGLANLYGFRASWQGTGPSLITNWSKLALDGVDITASAFTTYTTSNKTAIATYIQTNRFVANSTHSVTGLVQESAAGRTLTFSNYFVVPNWITMPTNFALAFSAVDQSKPGFNIRPYQGLWIQPNPNSLYWTEEMLAGLKGPNTADFFSPGADPSIYEHAGVPDFGTTGGFFTSTTIDPTAFGIPGSQATNSIGAYPFTDNFAFEMETYVYFPTNGVYQMFVGSDDGFRISVAGHAGDCTGLELMAADVGRGMGTPTSGSTVRAIIIDQPGVYPIRIIWENGGGNGAAGNGYGFEWYAMYGNNTNYILVNDDGSVTGTVSPVKAYRVCNTTTPYVKTAIPVRGAINVMLDQNIVIDLVDGTKTVSPSAVTFQLDGSTRLSATVTKSGSTNHIVYNPSSLWTINTTHRTTLIYQDNVGASYTNSWTWTTINPGRGELTVIDPSWGVPLSQIDTTQPGFRIRSYQTVAANNNTIVWTEEQLMGLKGANIALSSPTNNGYYSWPGMIDFSGHAGGGVANQMFPGGGGATNGGYNMDLGYLGMVANNPTGAGAATNEPRYCTLDVGTWLYFPKAGVYTMIVNSDDNFKLTVSPRKDTHDQFGVPLWDSSSRSSGGNYSGVWFNFQIQAPGAYPFRLLWENGTGGASVEWSIYGRYPDGALMDLLVNDPNYPGTFQAYQVAKVEPPHLLGTYPGSDYSSRLVTPNTLNTAPGYNHSAVGSRTQTVAVALQPGSGTLNTGSIVLEANGVKIPASVTSAGSNNISVVGYAPDANNPATWWPPGGRTDFTLTYSDANGSYTNNFSMATEWWGVLTNAVPISSINTNQKGFLMRPYQVDMLGSAIPNRIASAEQWLAGLWGPNVVNVYSNLTYGPPDANGYFVIAGTGPTNGVVNHNGGGSGQAEGGSFTTSTGYKEAFWPGLPGIGVGASGGHHWDAVAVEILAYVEFPTNGIYTMGVNSDDGFLVTKGFAAPANNGALMITSPAVVAGTYPAVPGDQISSRQLSAPVSGKVVQALGVGGGTEAGTRPGVPKEGLPPLVNGPSLAGNIALVYRGTGNDYERVEAAKAAGAIGVIMVNNRPKFTSGDGWFPLVVGGDPWLDIPVVEIGQTNGDTFVAVMATNDVFATLTPVSNLENPTLANSPLGAADYGKGNSDVGFTVVVQQAGVYPLRLMWWNGTGGVNAEWYYLVNGVTTARVLVNDSTSTNGPALRAWYPNPTPVQQRPKLVITKSADGTSVTISWSGGTGVLQSSPAAAGAATSWTDVAGATNPYTTTISGAAKYFRLRQ